MRRLLSASILALAVAVGIGAQRPTSLFDPDEDIAASGRLFSRTFTDRDGLPQNAVSAIVAGPDGRIWAGTKDGLAVYDGRSWTSVPLPRSLIASVRSLEATSDGSIWVGTEGSGVARYRNGGWTTIATGDELPGTVARRLLVEERSGERRLWIGTDRGLSVVELDESFDVSSVTPVASVRTGLPDDVVTAIARLGGRLFIGTDAGLVRFEGDRVVPIPELAGAVVTSLLETESNGERTFWAGTTSGLWMQRGDEWRQWTFEPAASDSVIWCLASTHAVDGTPVIWAGTASRGLLRLESGKRSFVSREQGAPDNVVWSLLVTSSAGGPETLWVGSGGGGIGRLSPAAWTTFARPDETGASATYAVHESVFDGTFWFGFGTRIATYREGRWTGVDLVEGRTLGLVRAIVDYADDSGRVVAVGTDRGLVFFQLPGGEGRWVRERALPPSPVSALLATGGSERPELWVGTKGGVVRYRDGSWTALGFADGLPPAAVTALASTSGGLLAGTKAGVFRFDGERWHPLPGTPLPHAGVKCIRERSRPGGARELWIGTDGGGAFRRPSDDEGGEWRTLSTATHPALPNDVVYRIEEDQAGRVYLTTNRGIARLESLGTAGGEELFAMRVFTTDDGLPSNECNVGASGRDSRGRIWVGTIGGAAMLDPARERLDSAPKPLRLARVAVGGGVRELPLGELDHDTSGITFEYSLASYYREADTRFRTQLVGLEARPSEWTADPRREFPSLPAGEYVFLIWGRDYAGNVSGPIEVAFAVRPAPWNTWWAYGAYALTLLGIGLAVHRLRVRTFIEHERELSSLVAERTQNVEDEKRRVEEVLEEVRRLNGLLGRSNDALREAHARERVRADEAHGLAQQAQLQMLRYQLNPHFLFNVLNSIRALVEEDPARARQMVTELSGFLRYSLASNEAVAAVRDELQAVRNFLAIQKVRFEDGLEVEVDSDQEAERAEVPVFLLQPLVENAIKYGERTSRGVLRVRVSARKRGDVLRLRVSNSGTWVASDPGRSGSVGVGLLNIRRRLEQAYPDRWRFSAYSRDGFVHASIRIRLARSGAARI